MMEELGQSSEWCWMVSEGGLDYHPIKIIWTWCKRIWTEIKFKVIQSKRLLTLIDRLALLWQGQGTKTNVCHPQVFWTWIFLLWLSRQKPVNKRCDVIRLWCKQRIMWLAVIGIGTSCDDLFTSQPDDVGPEVWPKRLPGRGLRLSTLQRYAQPSTTPCTWLFRWKLWSA